MPEVDLVIIDIDDTFILTHDYVFRLENEIAISLGLNPISKEEHLKNWGKPLDIAVPERYPGIDLEAHKKVRPDILRKMIQTGEADQIDAANMSTLDELLERNKRLAILTSRTTEEAEHLLHPDHPINKKVERFYHKDNTTYHKPNPRVFDQAFKDFKIPPGRSVYVGDQPSDAQAALGAGMHFIAVLESGFRTERDFQGLKVDHFVKNFPDILQVIS